MNQEAFDKVIVIGVYTLKHGFGFRSRERFTDIPSDLPEIDKDNNPITFS